MLQVLRHLHPERDIVGEDEMLDPSKRKWRRKAKEALHLRDVSFINVFIDFFIIETVYVFAVDSFTITG